MPRFGLALSGGGLRATLFHLGVVRFLRDAGLLGEVTHIVSVSGGSILGAHLALNWGRYNGSAADFEAAASKVIAFVQSDARNQIARRIPFLVPLRFLQRLTLRGPSRTFTPTGLLEKLYAKHLYGDARVHQLPETPELHLLTTNMSEGSLCSFTRAGLIMQHRSNGGIKVEILPARLTPVALAVAASSAFPGFFPPALITADDLGLSEGEFPPQTFTDGGVYDNLGVRAFDLLEDLDPSLDQILVSDVGKPFSIVRSQAAGHDRPGHAGHGHPLGSRRAAREAEVPGRPPLPVRGGPGPGRPQGRSHGAPPGDPVGGRQHPDGPRSFLAAGDHRTGAARLLRGPQAVPDPPRPLRVEPAIRAAVGPDEGRRRARLAARQDGPRRGGPVAGCFSARDGPRDPAGPAAPPLGRPSRLEHTARFPRLAHLPLHPAPAPDPRRPPRAGLPLPPPGEHQRHDRRRDHPRQPGLPQDPRDRATQHHSRVDPAAGPGRFPGVAEGRLPRVQVRERHQLRRPPRLAIEDAGRGALLPEGPHPETGERGPPGPPVSSPPLRPDRLPRRAGEAEARRTPRPARGREAKTTWELEFDLSDVRIGSPTDIEIEATIHDFEARKGERENWLRYSPPATTEQASVWVLFPESRPYKNYRLIRYAATDPSKFQEVETQYTIDHPFGSIIAWSIVNAEVGYVYECELDDGMSRLGPGASSGRMTEYGGRSGVTRGKLADQV